MTAKRKAALEAAKENGKLLLAVCDRRCGNCKTQLPVLEGAELKDALAYNGITLANLTPAEAGDASLQTGARDMDGRQKNGWPLLNTFRVSKTGIGTKIGNALSMSDVPARVVSVAEVVAWAKKRFGLIAVAMVASIALAGCMGAYRGQVLTVNAEKVSIAIDQKIEGGADVAPKLDIEATVPADVVKGAILDAAVPGSGKAAAISPEAAKGILDAIKAKAGKTAPAADPVAETPAVTP